MSMKLTIQYASSPWNKDTPSLFYKRPLNSPNI